jgi:hypothetical protein
VSVVVSLLYSLRFLVRSRTALHLEIVALRHQFPIGTDPARYQLLPFKLSPDALAVIDDWCLWLLSNELDPESVLGMIRAELLKLQDPTSG